jgi:hypothetical protein
MTTKPLTKAFCELRKRGYFARQNWMCCQSCGWAAIPDGYDKAVFYHAQDADRLKATGGTMLAWHGDGAEICLVLQEAGLATDWCGAEDKRIYVSVEART